MNINPTNNISFRAKWSKETLSLVHQADNKNGTRFCDDLQEALDKNPFLKNYGGDTVELSITSKPGNPDYDRYPTVRIKQKFGNYTLSAVPKPKGNYSIFERYYLSEDEIIQKMAKEPRARKQILDTIAAVDKNFRGEFIDSFVRRCTPLFQLTNSEKCELFDNFFANKK
ncbi:MAG: hypothetical protein IJZ26_01740 [Clostridia bacterium]|nr:hypothetical protein [Clostridia bacterium]